MSVLPEALRHVANRPGALVRWLAGMVNPSADLRGLEDGGGKIKDFRPEVPDTDPSLSVGIGRHGGAVFNRFGGDGFQGGAVAFVASCLDVSEEEAARMLIDRAELADTPAGSPKKGAGSFGGSQAGQGSPKPSEGPAKRKARRFDAGDVLEKLGKQGPLTPEALAFALRGWEKITPEGEGPEVEEVKRRGLLPALRSGVLIAYRFTGKTADGKTRPRPKHVLPGAVGFEVRGPDGQVWALKARNPGTKEDLSAAGVTRYVYLGKDWHSPAWCAPDFSEDLARPVLIFEGELNAMAGVVMLEAKGQAHAYRVQGVASAEAWPHVSGISSGSVAYLYADPDEAGEAAREKWGKLCAHMGAEVRQVRKRKNGVGVFSLPTSADLEAGEVVTAHDACDYLGAGGRVEIKADNLAEALDRARVWTPAPEVAPEASEEGAAKKKREKKPAGLRAKAQAVAQKGEGLPEADAIPDPEGQGGSFSDEQIKDLLGLDFPTVSADSDTAHAYRLRKVAGEDLAYIPEFGGYAAFTGPQWVAGGKDGPGQVEAKRRAQGLGAAMRPEVARLLALYGVLEMAARQEEERSGRDSSQAKRARSKAEAMEKAYFQHARAAKATEGDTKQKAILNSARPLYVRPISDFEPRPWVVGFQNGVWDKGEFRPARREDYMLTLAAVDYLPDVDRSAWLEVLARITGGNEDLARTLQDVAGYALSGASSLRLLPWLYGEGGTGKGTFSEMLGTVLGEMAVTISPKHLATDADRERLGAALFGRRVALCAEAGNARLDAESLKTLSGGDRLAVRRLYAETFTARPSHVLLMVANDAPRVEAYDDALKDRVLALPFTHPLKAGGPLLGGKRLEELRQDPKSGLVRGFAAWAVEGLARVHKTGDIYRAAVCRQATRSFWADVDPLRDFWPLLDPSALAVDGVGVADMRRMYEDWAKQSGARPMTSQKFTKAAQSVGLGQAKKTGGRRVWVLEDVRLFPYDGEGVGQVEGADGEEEGGAAWAMDFV